MFEEEIIVIEDDDEDEEIPTIEEAEELVYPALQEKEVTPSGEIQEIIPDDGVYGLSKVTVDKINLQNKTVIPSKNEQVIIADNEFSGLDNVTISGDDNLIPQNIAENKEIFGVTGTAKVEIEETFDLSTIDPYGIEQILVNDNYNNGQYSNAVILLLYDTNNSIKLKGAVAYKTSDGQFYTSNYNTEVTHNWDKSKDVENSEGDKVRWLILYNPNTGLYNSNRYDDVIATIWSNCLSVNRYGSNYLNSKIRNVKYIKFINCSGDTNFSSAFRDLPLLKQIDGLENVKFNSSGINYMCLGDYSLIKPIKFSEESKNVKVYDGGAGAYATCYSLSTPPDFNDFNNPDNQSDTITTAICSYTKIKKIGVVDLSNFKSTLSYLFSYNSELESVEELNLKNASETTYCLYDCKKLKRIKKLDISNSKDVSNFFSGDYLLEEIPYIDTSKVQKFNNFATNNYSLKVIKNLDFTSCISASNMVSRCYSLMEIENISNINVALSFSDCTLLSHETLIKILNALVDLTGQTSKTLTLGAANKAKLTNEELQIAINKNWSVN